MAAKKPAIQMTNGIDDVFKAGVSILKKAAVKRGAVKAGKKMPKNEVKALKREAMSFNVAAGKSKREAKVLTKRVVKQNKVHYNRFSSKGIYK